MTDFIHVKLGTFFMFEIKTFFYFFQSVMSLFLLLVHDQEIGQKQLDRRRHLQTHRREKHSAQSNIHIRG